MENTQVKNRQMYLYHKLIFSICGRLKIERCSIYVAEKRYVFCNNMVSWLTFKALKRLKQID